MRPGHSPSSAPTRFRSQQGGDWEASIYPSFANLDGIVLIRGGYTTKIAGIRQSTLLNLIGGIDSPTAGPGGAVRARAHLVPPPLPRFRIPILQSGSDLTVEENLLLPLELNGVTGRDAHDRALHQLEMLGLAARRASYPDRLSGGEQQRVAIARALVHDPALVLADEPTGNLDLETGRSVVAALDRATRTTGKTLVMVTHSREVVGQADRVLRLSNGRLSEQPKTR